MVYEDFELLATDVEVVKAEGKKRVTFAVRVPRSPAGEIVEAVPAEYDAREMREQLRDWEHRELDWPDLIQVGHWLGNLLFPPPIGELLLRSLERVQAEGKGLRVRLLLEDQLYNIPWEYVLLNRGGGEAMVADFLGLMPAVSIVRHQAAALPAWEVEAELPARMVVALASPAGYPTLQLDEERRSIEQALEGNEHIQATIVPQATPGTLLPEGKRAHLFHFAGHGDFERRMGVQPGTVEGEGVILLEDGYGDPAPLDAGQLALRLRQAGVRAAVLGACRSGRRDDVNVWSSVAAALLKAELGAVVGMQYTIRDDSAIAFARAFYRALVAGLSIDEAVTNGRLAIAREDVRGWGVPVLYLRAVEGIVFPEYAGDPALEEAREQLRVDVRQRVKALYGELVGVRIQVMERGAVRVEQEVDTVGEGGEVTGVEIERLGGGAVGTEQKVDTVEEGGSVTGVSIDEL